MNSIQLRVPCDKLDSLLTEISQQIDYLDYRIIKAKDVSLELVSNNMTQKRTTKSGDRIESAIDKKGKKLDENVNGEEKLTNTQNIADDAHIANLYLKDQINFSTIDIEIYQRESIKRDLYFNNKNTEAYEPGFFSKLGSKFISGWIMLKETILFLVGIWWLVLLITFGLYFFLKADNNSKIKK